MLGSIITYISVDKQPQSFIAKLKIKNVTRDNITKMMVTGDESSRTQGKTGLITDKNDIIWIWDRMLKTAEPYSNWESSGNRKLSIYTNNQNQPTLTLYVNATDSTTISDDDQGYICLGLHNILLATLEK